MHSICASTFDPIVRAQIAGERGDTGIQTDDFDSVSSGEDQPFDFALHRFVWLFVSNLDDLRNGQERGEHLQIIVSPRREDALEVVDFICARIRQRLAKPRKNSMMQQASM